MRRWVILCSTVGSSAALWAHAETLEYPDLVRRLWDLEHLAVLPAAGERCAQWSSYDRRSRYDAQTDRYIDWNANGDGTGIIREEGDRVVLAEMDGPGCIWRIWSAMPGQGRVALVLDGEVVVDLPFTNYFAGQTPPFDQPNLSYCAARGHNLYIPIPYRRSCKVLAEKNWGRYYHITYSTFPPDTVLPRFTHPLPRDWSLALTEADFRLGVLLAEPGPTGPDLQVADVTFEVPARTTVKFAEIHVPRRIVLLRSRVEMGDRADQERALREMVLRAYWDGDSDPAIECPMGDFFGTAPGMNPHVTRVTWMDDLWMTTRWPMPFKSAKIEVTNDGETTRRVHLWFAHVAEERPLDQLGRLYVRWHRGLSDPLRPDRAPDWPFLIAEGRGRFCGLMLHVWNPHGGSYEPARPGHYWWGEGDEKFFVDGERFPSTFGTGTEDYFGYAWGCPDRFERAFHAQTMTEGNRGHQSLVRWHIADNVPFQSRFEGCLEKYFPDSVPTLYAATVFWYMAPGGRHSIRLPPVEHRVGYWVRPPPRAGGFELEGVPPGRVQTQGMSVFPGGSWDHNDQLWWTGAKPGDRMGIRFHVPRAGRYTLRLMLTRANDYGIVQFDVDRRPVGSEVDLYAPAVSRFGPVDLGPVELSEGAHVLGVTIVGSNPSAKPSFMFGLDTLECIPETAP